MCTITIGKIGTFTFPRRWYTYTGNALNGLEQRIVRHLRKRKKRFWHIDYLLDKAKVVSVKKYLTTALVKCVLNSILLECEKGEVIVGKFGSSNCSCHSHLI